MASVVQKGGLEDQLSGKPGEATLGSKFTAVNHQLGD